MSHIVELETQMLEEDLVLEAVKEMGFTLTNNEYIKDYSGSRVKVDIKLTEYVGLVKRNGKYIVVGDTWKDVEINKFTSVSRTSVNECIKDVNTKLGQEYAVRKTLKEINKKRKKKYAVKSKEYKEGKLIAVIA